MPHCLVFEHFQGWWLHNFPGEPVPTLNHSFSDGHFPNIQPEPPLCYLWLSGRRSWPSPQHNLRWLWRAIKSPLGHLFLPHHCWSRRGERWGQRGSFGWLKSSPWCCSPSSTRSMSPPWLANTSSSPHHLGHASSDSNAKSKSCSCSFQHSLEQGMVWSWAVCPAQLPREPHT